MKKRKLIFVLLLSCAMLCGCGSRGSGSPYLTETERDTLVQQLLESIDISYDPNYPTTGDMTLENSSDYTLTDFYLMRHGANNMVITYFSSLPAHTKACASAYLADDGWDQIAKSGETSFYLNYTIGEYSYTAEDLSLRIAPESSLPAGELTVRLEVEDEAVTVEMGQKLEFDTGTEINGVSSARIYSLLGSVDYSSYGEYYYGLSFEVDGSKPASGALVYKLVDEEDVIWASGDISFYSGDIHSLYIGAHLIPGTYTLLFEEIK